jgi:hypothetical protein
MNERCVCSVHTLERLERCSQPSGHEGACAFVTVRPELVFTAAEVEAKLAASNKSFETWWHASLDVTGTAQDVAKLAWQAARYYAVTEAIKDATTENHAPETESGVLIAEILAAMLQRAAKVLIDEVSKHRAETGPHRHCDEYGCTNLEGFAEAILALDPSPNALEDYVREREAKHLALLNEYLTGRVYTDLDDALRNLLQAYVSMKGNAEDDAKELAKIQAATVEREP